MKDHHKDLDKVIRNVIRDMNANRPVEKIAQKNCVDIQLVEDILQIYTTHPGIDLDGILDRLQFYL
ncbi:MAG: hypothetical protein IJL90_00770 [Lachnospiraceae bacterium]|nr:hypothetical protein [Lachnospiraceae bacterium]MBR4573347.1 hypothetical protein [Lachnospiraceae bacterium]